jgi:hypothetical protein
MIGLQDILREDIAWANHGRDQNLFANIAGGPRVRFVLDQFESRYVTEEVVTDFIRTAGVDAGLEIVQVDRHHDWSYRRMKKLTDWMLRQRRRRPKAFSYLSYGNRPGELGAWGIEMEASPIYDRADPGTWAYFTCRIEGDTVRINSRNTERLVVRLGQEDDRSLQLSGEVDVIWNGQAAFRGPADTIHLPCP